MAIDINELRKLAQAVSGWSSCNQAWLDQSEDVPAAAVGHIDEDGNVYPVATIDCDQYHAAHQSLPLAKFYAAANPAAITELLDRLEAAEKERDQFKADWLECLALAEEAKPIIDQQRSEIDALRAQIERMEKQEPYSYIYEYTNPIDGSPVWRNVPGYWNNQFPKSSKALYALPGAQPAPSVPEVTDAMALAFHAALTDGSIGEHEMEEIKAGLRAALAAAPEAKP